MVGTTTDYIQWIRESRPGQAVFLTDPGTRRMAREPAPGPEEEILCNLGDVKATGRLLYRHLKRFDLELEGVACFDCEAMILAAGLAAVWGLPYPSLEAVRNCRDKYRSKQKWRDHHLVVPDFRCVHSADQAVAFWNATGSDCVLKPLDGTGSELIFCARTARETRNAFEQIQQGRQRRPWGRGGRSGAEGPVLIEARIQGDEYSCDFIVSEGQVHLIRLTRKMPAVDGPFGTIGGYVLCQAPPPGIETSRMMATLLTCARVLGLERAFCMLDFMVCGNQIILIEIAPRPGGDCLPDLLRCARGVDVLSLYLDFSRQRPPIKFPLSQGDVHIGLRLHATRGGRLQRFDTGRLERHPWVRQIRALRPIGSRIVMPPMDYQSWLLGHVIFASHGGSAPEEQCRMVLDQVEVEIW